MSEKKSVGFVVKKNDPKNSDYIKVENSNVTNSIVIKPINQGIVKSTSNLEDIMEKINHIDKKIDTINIENSKNNEKIEALTRN